MASASRPGARGPARALYDSDTRFAHPREVAELLRWAGNRRELKVSRQDIPSGVNLGSQCAGELIDIRVSCRGPDDDLYDRDERLRRDVPRGLTLLSLRWRGAAESAQPHGTTAMGIVLHGLRKFTGLSSFDDDDRGAGDDESVEELMGGAPSTQQPNTEPASPDGALSQVDLLQTSKVIRSAITAESAYAKWKRYFIAPVATATSVTILEKANGECAHLAVVDIPCVTRNRATRSAPASQLPKQRILIMGSKNTHMAVQHRGQIRLYTSGSGGQRYAMASRVAQVMFHMLETLEDAKREALLDSLAESGHTACFELLLPDFQHVVAYNLPGPELRFFALTHPLARLAFGRRENDGLCISPESTIRDMRERFGVPCVGVCDSPTVENQLSLDVCIRRVREQIHTEGAVMYFHDAEGRVIGLWKMKSVWYVIIRAIRERVKSHRMDTMDVRLRQMASWLGLSPSELALWRARASRFAEFLRSSRHSLHPKDMQSRFATVWEKFEEHERVSGLVGSLELVGLDGTGAPSEHAGRARKKWVLGLELPLLWNQQAALTEAWLASLEELLGGPSVSQCVVAVDEVPAGPDQHQSEPSSSSGGSSASTKPPSPCSTLPPVDWNPRAEPALVVVAGCGGFVTGAARQTIAQAPLFRSSAASLAFVLPDARECAKISNPEVVSVFEDYESHESDSKRKNKKGKKKKQKTRTRLVSGDSSEVELVVESVPVKANQWNDPVQQLRNVLRAVHKLDALDEFKIPPAGTVRETWAAFSRPPAAACATSDEPVV